MQAGETVLIDGIRCIRVFHNGCDSCVLFNKPQCSVMICGLGFSLKRAEFEEARRMSVNGGEI